MDRSSELYKIGLALHGHKCPAMSLGLCAGLAAMEALGVQVVTVCTFGKGNIRSLGYGKFALTLIDNKTARGVRVVARPQMIRRNQESEFLGQRRQGVPASQIDAALAEPLVDAVLADPDEKIDRILSLAERNSTVISTVRRAVPITGNWQRG